MSFLDRLRLCRYVDPGGWEHALLFDDLERSGGKKIAVHELPGRDIPDVQEFGNLADEYPMEVYFTGADYDLAADLFAKGLKKHGRGKLQHPRWGDLDVLPVTVSQSEKFVDGMRMARFSVKFVHAPDPTSLTVTTTTAAAIRSGAQAAADSIAAMPAAVVSSVEAVNEVNKGITLVGLAMAAFGFLSGVAADVSSRMAAAQRAMTRGFTTMLGDMPGLYFAIVDLVRMPAAVETDIKSKVSAYYDTIHATILSIDGFSTDIAMLLGLTAAAAESTATGTLASRADAIDAYNLLTDSADEALRAIEPYSPDPATVAAVRQLASDARARLLVESYSLPTERTMVLQGDTTPIQLAATLYRDPEQYQRVIDENALADSAIFVVPRGTEVRWYE